MTDVVHVANPNRCLPAGAIPEAFRVSQAEFDAIKADPSYQQTPLVLRPALAERLGVAQVAIKDESVRLHSAGLSCFKALGILGAMQGPMAGRLANAHTLVCASDGNYGRALAWAATRLGYAARIFVPEAVSPTRARAIVDAGGEVVRVPGGYDDAMAAAAAAAREPGVVELSDTGYPGAEDMPLSVSRGYGVIADECLEAWPDAAPPTHLFVPVGVGSLAAGMIARLSGRLGGRMPIVVAVEPLDANCLMASFKAGRIVSLCGPAHSVMIGLACETPSTSVWSLLFDHVDHTLAIEDIWALRGVRELADGRGDKPIIAGETGAACYGALLAVAQRPALRAALNLGPASRVLLPVTEGATDPDRYAAIVHGISPITESGSGPLRPSDGAVAAPAP